MMFPHWMLRYLFFFWYPIQSKFPWIKYEIMKYEMSLLWIPFYHFKIMISLAPIWSLQLKQFEFNNEKVEALWVQLDITVGSFCFPTPNWSHWIAIIIITIILGNFFCFADRWGVKLDELILFWFFHQWPCNLITITQLYMTFR